MNKLWRQRRILIMSKSVNKSLKISSVLDELVSDGKVFSTAVTSSSKFTLFRGRNLWLTLLTFANIFKKLAEHFRFSQ
jgi:hypothetical protein